MLYIPLDPQLRRIIKTHNLSLAQCSNANTIALRTVRPQSSQSTRTSRALGYVLSCACVSILANFVLGHCWVHGDCRTHCRYHNGLLLLAHEPELDPFRTETPQDAQSIQPPYTPHPVDKLVLDGAQKLKRKMSTIKAATPTTAASAINLTKRNTRLENTLLKVSSLAISD
jgi:hypothetical protein